jgi:hypothetical protein
MGGVDGAAAVIVGDVVLENTLGDERRRVLNASDPASRAVDGLIVSESTSDHGGTGSVAVEPHPILADVSPENTVGYDGRRHPAIDSAAVVRHRIGDRKSFDPRRVVYRVADDHLSHFIPIDGHARGVTRLTPKTHA